MKAEQQTIKDDLSDRVLLARMGLLKRSLRFWNTYDLGLLIGLALLLIPLTLLPFPPIRIVYGIGMVLVAPGYALVEMVFARRADLDFPARLGLSFGLSLAVIPTLALILSWLPWGIRPTPMLISLSIWIVLFSGLAIFRRWRLSPYEPFQATAPLNPLGWWQGQKVWAKVGLVVGGPLLVGGTILVFTIIALPDPATKYTEFYLVGNEGLAENYPRSATVGSLVQLKVGLVNHEGKALSYQKIEVRRTTESLVSFGPINLANESSLVQPITFTINSPGFDQRVEILLFLDGSDNPYRRLYLWLNVE